MYKYIFAVVVMIERAAYPKSEARLQVYNSQYTHHDTHPDNVYQTHAAQPNVSDMVTISEKNKIKLQRINLQVWASQK